MDSILQHLPLTVEVGKLFSFLCVCEHRVVSNSKSSVKATLRFAGLEYRTKFSHGTFEMTFANAFGTEFILVNAARLQSSEFSLQTSGFMQHSSSSNLHAGWSDDFSFAHDVRFATKPDHILTLVF